MTLSEVGLTLTKYSLLFPNSSLSPEVIKVWHQIFKDESVEDFHAAFLITIKRSAQKFMPVPGEIYQAIKSIHNSTTADPELVWNEVITLAERGFENLAAITHFGMDPVAQHAIRATGMTNIRTANIQTQLPFIRKQFIQTYKDRLDQVSDRKHIEISHQQSKEILRGIPGTEKIKALN